MRAVSSRFAWLFCAIVVLSTPAAHIGAASAQDATSTGLEGNAYTSPTFGYTLNWDDGIWTAGDEVSEDGYDSIHVYSDASDIFFEGMYFYQGDANECIAGEKERTAQEAELDALDPFIDEDGQPIEGASEGDAFGLYALPETADDGTPIDTVVYIECQTIVPGNAILVITAFFPANDLMSQAEAVQAVVETIDPGVVAGDSFDSSDLELVARQSGVAIDSYWESVFSDAGVTYERPKFISYSGPIETECGEATSGEDGPFYCPADQTVYLDLDMLHNEMLPYGVVVVEVVIAHEIGHHVQNLLQLDGCTETVCGAPGSSLAIELQADCLAGAWTQDAASQGIIRENDIKRIDVAVEDYFGDPPDTPKDDPDAHGSGEDRVVMFHAGYEDGPPACGLE